MIKMNEFAQRVKEEIGPLLPEDVERISIFPVVKNNGVVLEGLVCQNSLNITPTIYLNPFYVQYKSGRSFEAILAEIAKMYTENQMKNDFDVSNLYDWDFVKTHLVRKLVNFEQNQAMLKDMPHMKVEDLAVVYQIYVGDILESKDYATVAVRDNMMKAWDVDLFDLDATSLESTREIFPPKLDSLAVVFKELNGMELPFLEEMNIHILTNRHIINGAAYVTDMEVMDEVASVMETDKFYVLPSSIHEVLIFPYDEEYDYRHMEELIQEVNETQLMEEEILSDRLYFVDTKEHKFMQASKYEAYQKELELRERQKELNEESLHKEPEVGPKL